MNIDHYFPSLWKYWLICVAKAVFRFLQTIQEQGVVVSFPMKEAWDFSLEPGAVQEGSSEVKSVRSRETIKVGDCHTSLFPCVHHSLRRAQFSVAVWSCDYVRCHGQPYPVGFT